MSDGNDQMILYFEGSSMRSIHEALISWQNKNKKRLLSISINPEEGGFSCVAITNPMEVIIVDGTSNGGASVSDNQLWIYDGHL